MVELISLPCTPIHSTLDQTSLQVFSKIFHHFLPLNFRGAFLKFSNQLDGIQELFSCTWQILQLFQWIPLYFNKCKHTQDSQNGILRNGTPTAEHSQDLVVILGLYVLRCTSQFFQFHYSCHCLLLTYYRYLLKNFWFSVKQFSQAHFKKNSLKDSILDLCNEMI